MGYFSREILIHRHWRQVRRSQGEVSWHGASCLRTSRSLNLAFDFGRNTTTLNKFIGYIDLTDFCKISPKYSRNNHKRKCVGNFDIWNIYRVVSIYATHLAYFSYSNFKCRYPDKQSECRRSLTKIMNKTVQPICSCCGIRYPINSKEEPSVVSRLTNSWHFLKRKVA